MNGVHAILIIINQSFMKLKNLFLPLIAITMCAGFASCDDDDDNDDQEYINSLENILTDSFGFGISRCTCPEGMSIEELLTLPHDNNGTTGVFEKLNYMIAFNRDHTFTLYEYVAEDVNDIENAISGNWFFENRNCMVFDVNINGKMERVNVKLVEKPKGSWPLFYLRWPGEANAIYYVFG